MPRREKVYVVILGDSTQAFWDKGKIAGVYSKRETAQSALADFLDRGEDGGAVKEFTVRI